MVNAKDFQFDTMVDTAKDVAIKTVAFNSTLAQSFLYLSILVRPS